MEYLQDFSCSSTSKSKQPLAKSTAAIILSLSLFVGLSSAQAAGLDGVPFPPDYPAGPSYDAFAFTLEGFGLIVDADADGLQNDRCSADGEAFQQIVLGTEKVLAVLANEGCDGDLEPISRAACFGLNIVLQELVVATEINIAQCDHQDGSIDAAEIEASYENTVTLLADLVLHDNNLDTHDADIKEILARLEGKMDTLIGGQAESHRLLHTPNGRRISTYYPDACNDGDGCEWNDR